MACGRSGRERLGVSRRLQMSVGCELQRFREKTNGPAIGPRSGPQMVAEQAMSFSIVSLTSLPYAEPRNFIAALFVPSVPSSSIHVPADRVAISAALAGGRVVRGHALRIVLFSVWQLARELIPIRPSLATLGSDIPRPCVPLGLVMHFDRDPGYAYTIVVGRQSDKRRLLSLIESPPWLVEIGGLKVLSNSLPGFAGPK